MVTVLKPCCIHALKGKQKAVFKLDEMLTKHPPKPSINTDFANRCDLGALLHCCGCSAWDGTFSEVDICDHRHQ